MMIHRAGLLILMILSVEAFSQQGKLDSVTMPISNKYADAGLIKKFLWGTNYREVWEEPVKTQVFYLGTSGYTIKKLGGGQQTRSLRLEDKKGNEWVLRTVDKDVSNILLPPLLPRSFVLPLIQDIISASFPYSPLIVSELARSTGIIAARPQLFWVADDEALGEYRALFANQFCILEEREPTPDNSDTKSTENVLEDIMGENENLIIQKFVLKARLLDLLVADWDRHADQWRWDKLDGAGIDYYYGIPRDRDQAFFLSNGLIVRLARIVGMKQLVGFQQDLHLKRLNKKSWTFDRTFLNNLSRNEWQEMINEFTLGLTDKAIESAVQKLPPEIFRISGTDFISKLKKRRDDLGKKALVYYEHISKMVVINGTPEEEIFYFQNKDDGLEVKVIDKKSNRIIYYRVFQSPETWKIIAAGNGGNDSWQMSEQTASRLRIEIQGGDEKDHYYLKGNVRTVIMDNKSGTDVFELGNRIRKKLK